MTTDFAQTSSDHDWDTHRLGLDGIPFRVSVNRNQPGEVFYPEPELQLDR